MKLRVGLLLILLLTIIGSTSAQEPSRQQIRLNDFSFSYPSEWGQTIHTEFYPAQELAESNEPGWYAITLYGDTEYTEHKFTIYVLEIEEVWLAYPSYQEQLQILEDLLTNRPDLAEYMGQQNTVFPELPHPRAAQVLRAKAHYVDLETMSGIGYIGLHIQNFAPPFSADAFDYIFVGFSHDYRYFINARFEMETSVSFAEVELNHNDAEAFRAVMDEYLLTSTNTLNEASAEMFTPRLSEIDTVINTFTVHPN